MISVFDEGVKYQFFIKLQPKNLRRRKFFREEIYNVIIILFQK